MYNCFRLLRPQENLITSPPLTHPSHPSCQVGCILGGYTVKVVVQEFSLRELYHPPFVTKVCTRVTRYIEGKPRSRPIKIVIP